MRRKSSRRKGGIKKNTNEKFEFLKSKIQPPIIQTLDNPLVNLTIDEKKEFFSKLSTQNKILLEQTLFELTEILKEFSPEIILSFFSAYSLSIGVNDNGVETVDETREIEQPHIEILQALALMLPKDMWGKEPLPPHNLQIVHDKIKDLLITFSYSRMNPEVFDLEEKEKGIVMFQEFIRNHTSNIRNWGYFSQVKVILLELYGEFDNLLKEKVGFSPSEVINVFSSMIAQTEKLMTQHSNRLKDMYKSSNRSEMIRRFNLFRGANANEENKLNQVISKLSLNREALFNLILSYENQNLPEIFSFSLEEISDCCGIHSKVIEQIFDYFSYEPGDLEESNPEFFFLDNPIWKKPIIKINDAYFCPIPILFFSNSFTILDSLIEKYFKDALHVRRSVYLEQKIEAIVKKRFPDISTVAKVNWFEKDTQYETDLITFIDVYAIIIEAKSHRISSAALRGAPDRIKRHIKEIIISPGIQSKRLEERLQYLIENPNVDDELRQKLPVDLKNINKILRISVSLEDFATLQSNIGNLKATEWMPSSIELCPTLNLADFETVFDFLDHPVHIIHYFERRTELLLDEKVNITGDELDYLGFYSGTLFSYGYINEDSKDNLNITMMSSPIDHYYSSKDAGIDVPKPGPQICEIFKNILIKLEERSTPGWTVLGVALSRYSPTDQEKITNFITHMKLKISNNWDAEDLQNFLIFAPPYGSEYGLAFVLYSDSTIHRKYEFIESAESQVFNNSYAKYALIIAKNIDDNESPYNYIAVGRKIDD
ncbi:hypothetical protein CH367_07870 [Leptospira barantonii]|uniref:NERD domain-containing protein n=1 Tax=Leptospira barantonii TaxID=2023184 RepID=A0ABX4NTV8_9LEPT|nr:hypothetical protein CH367_07870 [Leptospira barantonii]